MEREKRQQKMREIEKDEGSRVRAWTLRYFRVEDGTRIER